MSAERDPLMGAYARFRRRHTQHADRCRCGRSLPCSELTAWEATLAAILPEHEKQVRAQVAEEILAAQRAAPIARGGS